MLDWVGDPYQIAILAGVTETVTSAGANLLCFVGGSLPADPQASARHRIFDFVGPQSVDGVVVLTATLMHQVGRGGVESFCKTRLHNLPHCSIGVTLPGVPSVTAKNDQGIQQVVGHLTNEHGHRRIAFVRGPLANEEAEQRFLAYVEALKDHDLSFDPRLVAVGNFMQSGGIEAVRTFAQIPGMRLEDLDAIIASNDGMAVGVLKALDERGVSVPRTVAVTGFDDVEEARLATSPLTTIRQPLENIGRQAARNVLQYVNLGTTPANVEIDTELVVRRSCGCSRSARIARHSAAPELNYSFEAAFVQRRQHILEALSRAARGGLGVAGPEWQPKLLNALIAEMTGDKPDAFRSMIDHIGQKLSERGADIQVCHDVVDVLRRQISVTLRTDPNRRDRAEEIFYSTHVALSEIQQCGMSREGLRLGRWGRDISEVCNSLSRTFDIADLRYRIRELLPTVGLTNYFVVAYSDDRKSAQAELLAACDNGRQIVLPTDNSFDGATLLPRQLMESIRTGRAFAVIPLTWKALSLGHVLIELNFASLFCYDVIAEAIASGLFGARLAAKHCGKCFGGQVAV
jgi:phosphoserine phosphatase RsbU/P